MAEKEIEIISEAKEQFKKAYDDCKDNREEAIDDLEFLNGEQWSQSILVARQSGGRPSLVINKLPSFVDQVVGDQRQNRPAIKARPVDDEADIETADIMTGLIRNIEYISQADLAYDTAFECAVACGEGYWRVITEYVDDDIFDQDIKIKRIPNPFTVYFYPYHELREYDCSDAKSVFITEWLLRKDFEARWPDKDPINWESAEQGVKNYWANKEYVRVAEWFRKVPVTKTIWKTVTGQVWDSSKLDDEGKPTTREKLQADGVQIIDERTVKSHKIVWYKITGKQVLDKPKDWAGKYLPVIPVWGKEMNIQGKRLVRGLVRHSKDPQRLYNYSRSHYAEVVALAPKAPYVLTAKMIQGHEDAWGKAHRENLPYLLYNVDENAPNVVPTRQIPNISHTGIKDQIVIADQELHDTTGLQPASLGEKSNEKSGRAIIARQREGDVASFAFIDNLARSMTYGGKVLVDLMPRIYDTERILRILGEDGSVKTITARPGVDKDIEKNIYDITAGKYDVTVTVGPSYTTQRQEAAESMMEFCKVLPPAAGVIADLVAKNMDWPGAQEIADRLKKLLPPGLAEQEPDEAGTQPPGPMAPPGPPPQLQAAAETMAENEIEMAEVKLEQEKAKLAQEKAKIKGVELDNEKKRAEIKAARAGGAKGSQARQAARKS